MSTSASSWGCELKFRGMLLSLKSHPVSLFVRLWVEILSQTVRALTYSRQPLREAVSWNYLREKELFHLLLSASSWGCELKCQRELVKRRLGHVSLFVRLWVEISIEQELRVHPWSASSWGCELKYIQMSVPHINSLSASSWGCELKWTEATAGKYEACQPLREAVSWNIRTSTGYKWRYLSASSWGCELKYRR